MIQVCDVLDVCDLLEGMAKRGRELCSDYKNCPGCWVPALNKEDHYMLTIFEWFVALRPKV